MRRPYRMTNRAAAHEETRERIVRATMALHDERGVATTSFADVAERAGVGPPRYPAISRTWARW